MRLDSSTPRPDPSQMTFIPTRLASRLALVACTLFAAGLSAQEPAPAPTHPPVPVAGATRRTTPISIDGRLDEDAWRQATPITEFRQTRPTEGAPATLGTEVRVLFDEDALYIGARMSEPAGATGIRAPLARRDQLLAANGNNGSFNSLTTDKIAIDLDPYHNHLDEVWFEMNPAGVRGDQFNGDPSWDPVWEGASHIDSAGWSSELRIPYSQLRFSRDSVQTWGLQIWRYVDRLNEQDMWSFRRRDEAGGPAYFGHLQGIAVTSRPRQLELLPYVVSRGQFKYAPPNDPYHDSRDMRVNAGADIKYNLTSNLTLDATINPDFGQVEVDPATLNLSAYETTYDEKRPFFVANRSAFSFGGTSCMFCSNFSSLSVLYSRRIGRPPQLNGWVSSRARYVDAPDDATILGAAKITGRTSSGYSVGVLDAVTGGETARFIPIDGGTERLQSVEPLTNYFMGRVRKELRQGATTVGVVATSTVRRLQGDSVLVSQLRDNATAVGLDWSHAWHNRVYRWRGSVVGSDVRGSPQAIALTQRSSTHYFQRPDRQVTSDGLFGTRFDTTATLLRGYGLYSRLAKESGNWNWELQTNWRSPGFEVNDLAALSRTDYRWMSANLQRSWLTPGRWYRSMSILGGGQQQFNYDGLRTDQQRQVYFGLELPNYWNVRSFAIQKSNTEDDRLTRGGPVVGSPGWSFGHLQVSTDSRRRAVFDISFEGSRGKDGTASANVSPGIALKPASNIFVQLSPTLDWAQNAQQYVRRQADSTATAFGGNRYVFGYVTTRQLSLETRVNWTMRPTVTLQLYAQPFFASGDYSAFGEYAAPRSLKQVNYGADVGTLTRNAAAGTYTADPDGPAGPAPAFTFGDPNFTSRSLRGTAVLRWEYRPGSTMFFVWTQQRSGDDAFGDFDIRRDARSLLGDRPENVFVVKATYWLGR
ncbi:MAG: putative rane associated hydrolase [Gemmatimonadetes bacterium]|nr:putative rane associated hydrolase [Gemmatimonadota bacterium]